MSKWSALAEADNAAAVEEADHVRRIAYSTYCLRAACNTIADEYNEASHDDMLKLEVGESSFSGFQISRADKQLRAVICTRPTLVDIQYIAGYRFDPTEHRVGLQEFSVSSEGAVIFEAKGKSFTPETLAHECCEQLLAYGRNV